jgi:hypothetical protein
MLAIIEEDLSGAQVGGITLEDCVDLMLLMLPELVDDWTFVSRERTVNAQGLPVQIITFTVGPGGALEVQQLVYVHDGRIIFRAVFLTRKLDHRQMEPLIDSSFNAFRVAE